MAARVREQQYAEPICDVTLVAPPISPRGKRRRHLARASLDFKVGLVSRAINWSAGASSTVAPARFNEARGRSHGRSWQRPPRLAANSGRPGPSTPLAAQQPRPRPAYAADLLACPGTHLPGRSAVAPDAPVPLSPRPATMLRIRITLHLPHVVRIPWDASPSSIWERPAHGVRVPD